MKLRFNSQHADWPHDFEDHVFLGTALAYINRALDRDAHDLDVTTTSTGEQPRGVPLLPGEPSDILGFRRASKARMLLGGRLNRGAINSFVHVDGTGELRELPATAWNIREEKHFPLEDFLNGQADEGQKAWEIVQNFPTPLYDFRASIDGVDDPPKGFVYVDRAAFEALMEEANPRTFTPTFGPAMLLGLADGHRPPNLEWNYLLSLAWLATGKEEVVAGADAYLRASSSLPRTPHMLHTVLTGEIPEHHCNCKNAICHCLRSAKERLQRAARDGEVKASGYRNGCGDLEDIPPSAWDGKVRIGNDVEIAPARPDGSSWSGILFRKAELLALDKGEAGQTARSDEVHEGMSAEVSSAEPTAILRGVLHPGASASERLHEEPAHNAAAIIRETGCSISAAIRQVREQVEANNREPDSIDRAIRESFNRMYSRHGKPKT